jgi:hypothetical protein
VRALRNLDFDSGIIYQAMGFPVEMFPVLFAIGRMPGWLAQWHEILLDPEQKIARPRHLYQGSGERVLAWAGAGVDRVPGGLRFGRPTTRRGVFSPPSMDERHDREVASPLTDGPRSGGRACLC